MRSKLLKILSVLVAVIIAFSCCCISASAATTYNFFCSRPQLQGSDCYVEFVTDTGIAGVVYVKAVLAPNLTSTTLNISFNASVSDNYLRIGVNPSSYSFDGEQMEITVRGLYYLDFGEFGSTTVESLRSCLFLGQIGNIAYIRSYNCNVSDIGVPNGDFVFAYANEVNLNEKLDTIIDILQNGGQSQIGAIIDNANENTDEIKQNQNENTDKILNGDSDLDSSGETDKVNGTIGGVDDATNNALGGKSEEEIQNEVSGALDTDNIDIDWTKANRMSTFYDRCLKAFGSEYSTLLLLSLILGLSAFLIGRRYG